MANVKSPLVAIESPHLGFVLEKPALVVPCEPLDVVVEGGGCGRFELQALFFGRLPPCRVLASRMR